MASGFAASECRALLIAQAIEARGRSSSHRLYVMDEEAATVDHRREETRQAKQWRVFPGNKM